MKQFHPSEPVSSSVMLMMNEASSSTPTSPIMNEENNIAGISATSKLSSQNIPMNNTAHTTSGGYEHLSIAEIDRMIEHFNKQISYLEKKKERMIVKSITILNSQHNNRHLQDSIWDQITYLCRCGMKAAFSDHQFCRLLLVEFVEIVLTLTVVLFGVVCFWRGIWELSEHYISVDHITDKNKQILYRGWVSLFIGAGISFITQLGSVLMNRFGVLNLLISTYEHDSKMEMAEKTFENVSHDIEQVVDVSSPSESVFPTSMRRTSHKEEAQFFKGQPNMDYSKQSSSMSHQSNNMWITVSMKFYTYIVAISIILCWKGSWMIMDAYFEKWWGEEHMFVINWASHIFAALVLIWMGTFRSVLSPASMDKDKHFDSIIVSKWAGMSRALTKDWVQGWSFNKYRTNA
ncbi:hypothetical protein C9374_006703 [Naegleria lovaniensis]|uniref:Uncharacterized protein n=1 Tax=Naegleria lovaniensis TaxID=51637 RepID=A0AA88KIV5_NAELO|nr:uncharacterized protein C9374_006703 [Naegleria lovaniensis]KAG2379586.1 hypothetical protein C9374_006703 [Naegleria lovaniensis]